MRASLNTDCGSESRRFRKNDRGLPAFARTGSAVASADIADGGQQNRIQILHPSHPHNPRSNSAMYFSVVHRCGLGVRFFHAAARQSSMRTIRRVFKSGFRNRLPGRHIGRQTFRSARAGSSGRRNTRAVHADVSRSCPTAIASRHLQNEQRAARRDGDLPRPDRRGPNRQLFRGGIQLKDVGRLETADYADNTDIGKSENRISLSESSA